MSETQDSERLWKAYERLRAEKARLDVAILPHLPRNLANRTRAIMALDLIDQLTMGGPFGDGRVLFSRFDLHELGAPTEKCFENRDFGRELTIEEAVEQAWKWCPLNENQGIEAFTRWLKDWRGKLERQGVKVPYTGPLPQDR